jgi:large subunit ribosomal protein L25
VSDIKLAAEPRTEFGKGAARRTRRAGRVPAVIYGHGTPVRHISLPARELMMAFRYGARPVLSIELDGSDNLVVPKAVVKDALTREIEHLDLLVVDRKEAASFEAEREAEIAAAHAAEEEQLAKIAADAEAAAEHEAEAEAEAAEGGEGDGESGGESGGSDAESSDEN